jgi:hypothetical protein
LLLDEVVGTDRGERIDVVGDLVDHRGLRRLLGRPDDLRHEALSVRAPLASTVPADDRWLVGTLAAVFEVA